MKQQIFKLVTLLIVSFALVACSSNNNEESTDQSSNEANNQDSNEVVNEDGEQMEVDLINGDEESVGTATLKEEADGVRISLKGENLPKGTHAFHVHENSTCEAPDFESAGGHFNPGDTDHGFDTEDGPHAGDLPNIVVGEDGMVEMSYLAEGVTLEEGADNSLLDDGGTSLVIHEDADDGESQPAGDAGDRLACGVISK